MPCGTNISESPIRLLTARLGRLEGKHMPDWGLSQDLYPGLPCRCEAWDANQTVEQPITLELIRN